MAKKKTVRKQLDSNQISTGWIYTEWSLYKTNLRCIEILLYLTQKKQQPKNSENNNFGIRTTLTLEKHKLVKTVLDIVMLITYSLK